MEVRNFISEKTSDELGEDETQGHPIIRCWDNAHGYQKPHRFKRHEWNCSKKELIEALATFRQVLISESDWQPNDVDHFLSCNFHLIKGTVMLHHIRCCVTLIRQGVIRRFVHRLGGLTE